MRKLLTHPAFLAGAAALGLTAAASAQSDPFIGQIQAVGENFCPRNFMPAAGQTLPISSYSALFSLLGCSYGGDCRSTFALPDLRGHAMIGTGQGPGLPYYTRGQSGGAATVTLTSNQLPSHNHNMMASTAPPTASSPLENAMPTYQTTTSEIYSDQDPGSAQLHQNVLNHAGGNIPMNIVQPTATLTYCVAVYGIYPSRG
ncbi:MAG: tail fiber protein [Alphaproteobacteria bacterium]|uniref:phage tail protein n=1 Tax=Maricaulis alexandrii TaxID=2570354 RepID=UPI001108B1E9|nr:tail fiber protein [Maricaulis alexandrii]MCR9266244.1 tail fiber protein [Alphaproteobacteria bacterium]